MTTPSFRDVERLSAYLDGQLSRAETTRLETRLQTDPALAAILMDLRQARAALRRTPVRRAPRNFILTPKMAGIRPPVPRAVPALSWASAMAMLLFVCTLGTNLVGRLSFPLAAPMAASDRGMGMGGSGSADAAQNGYGLGGGPVEMTPTPDSVALAPPADPSAAESLPVEPPAPKVAEEPANPWPFAWLAAALLLAGGSLAIRWSRQRAFDRRFRRK